MTTLLFEDTFDGPAGPITSRPGWEAKHLHGQHSTSFDSWRNVTLDGKGHLILTARKKPATDPTAADRPWSSAWLSNGEQLGAGFTGPRRSEARLKCPGGKGTWPAFWDWPYPWGDTKDTPFPLGLEVDTIEQLGMDGLGELHTTAHIWNVTGDNIAEKGTKISTGLSLTNFHVYAAEILSETITYFVDGKQMYVVKNTDLGVADFTIYPTCLNLTLDMGGWGGPVTCRSPRHMRVDYVRAWRI